MQRMLGERGVLAASLGACLFIAPHARKLPCLYKKIRSWFPTRYTLEEKQFLCDTKLLIAITQELFGCSSPEELVHKFLQALDIPDLKLNDFQSPQIFFDTLEHIKVSHSRGREGNLQCLVRLYGCYSHDLRQSSVVIRQHLSHFLFHPASAMEKQEEKSPLEEERAETKKRWQMQHDIKTYKHPFVFLLAGVMCKLFETAMQHSSEVCQKIQNQSRWFVFFETQKRSIALWKTK
mmetsp:Transcript_36927/g.95632  ORF Transcript_36927/g.95632 Transcript_36927/m.95632 type:complete len:235 (-) Transcript_36927:2991-3695(-)